METNQEQTPEKLCDCELDRLQGKGTMCFYCTGKKHDDPRITPDKPMDIENDPRYLEILNEEAILKGKFSFEDTKNHPNIFYSGRMNLLDIQLSAQRRFFTELLQEKDKYINQLNDRENAWYRKLEVLTTTIAEREDQIIQWNHLNNKRDIELENVKKQLSEAKATIEKLENKIFHMEDQAPINCDHHDLQDCPNCRHRFETN